MLIKPVAFVARITSREEFRHFDGKLLKFSTLVVVNWRFTKSCFF